jgi:AcrR family transcriptional regulator
VARPRSEDKRSAILAAAAEIFAERGLGAATSAISSAAGIAEGTLFTYFKTKDELLNALYQEIKMELATTMMSDFPRKKSVRNRLRHIWERFVTWGVADSVSRFALAHLEVSDRLTAESRAAGSAPFAEVETLVDDAAAQHLFRNIPEELIAASLRSLASAAMDLIAANPEMADRYRKEGFEIFWAGVTRKR